MSERKNILVVEDDREISNATCLRLAQPGFAAQALYEGGDVVRRPKATPPKSSCSTCDCRTSTA